MKIWLTVESSSYPQSESEYGVENDDKSRSGDAVDSDDEG